MNILNEFEECRKIIVILNNWENNIECKRQAATYGTGRRLDDVNVKMTKRNDVMEERIIDYQELEDKRIDLFMQFMDKRKLLNRYIYDYCKEANYISVLYDYFFIGKKIYEIPKCTKNTIKKALQHIQYNIDLEEEIQRQPPNIKELNKREKRKVQIL